MTFLQNILAGNNSEPTYSQIPFTVTLELLNGASHFSEEEANLIWSLVYFLTMIAVAALINIYAWHNDTNTFDRVDNPLLATLISLT